MNGKEMTELFTLMKLAWPYDEKFKGGIEQLFPTIDYWTKCLPDVDFWTGQQALVRLCRVCKYPPSIAEFLEQVENVNTEIRRRTEFEWTRVLAELHLGNNPRQIYDGLPPGSLGRLTMDAMGGPENIIQKNGLLNTYGFADAARAVIVAQGSKQPKIESGARQKAVLPMGHR